ncbi:MAG: BlaI/MecI/CopY family transcriptional regulator [Candidatus Eisenbacteria bacterium]|uniref:BlaI/MecI/CopY family transcriptional regulator n=1 Tax=Eiseniibacteriota bacterium TaxID=2212470 RepID=A0A948W6V0_UNCEI|nr:BlaI/MecI/CopY family transcriptional regulator [Candidatus Eisenbacteria bacterium]MBU1947916.1 BlaI/MecI/CopY family transcriptional regulator [Candidatus Eisenbacteria bacterium]MBU2691914.1 BlaI/MecI/CopY family transcriptional regulator [Candidatus Eisenbacteria bacterium]
MTRKPKLSDLTRRERQIMDIIFKSGEATAVEVVEGLPGRPVNATVRTLLNVLETKGYLRHKVLKGRFIYSPTISTAEVRRNMLKHVIETFFKGAEASAVISILKESELSLSKKDKEDILKLIKDSRNQGQ